MNLGRHKGTSWLLAISSLPHYSGPGYRTMIHRPVFDGLMSDRKEGFIQVNWESGSALPALIDEVIAVGADRRMDFTIRLDTGKGQAVTTSQGSAVIGVEKCIRLKNGWAVRVLLRKD